MVEIESPMYCCLGEEQDVILYVFDTKRKQFRFYISPYLDELKVKHDVKLKKIPNKKDPSLYDVLIYCPICGKPTNSYIGVPMDWECLASPGALISIPIEQVPKSWYIKLDDLDKIQGDG